MNRFHTHFKIAVVGLKLVKAEVDRFNLHMQFDCFKIVHAKQLVTWRTLTHHGRKSNHFLCFWPN